MTDDEWWCTDCQSTFVASDTPEQCTQCGSEGWVPFREPNHSDSEDGSPAEFRGSKEVIEYDFTTHERASPRPNVQQLRITTEDGWEYVFREPGPNDGYELYEKHNPTGSTSDDDVVPVAVAEYIDEMVVASLNYAKLVIHPSDGVYKPPRE